MSPGLKSNPDLHPCKPGQKFRAALLRCRSPAAAAGILSFGNVLNYMDRYTVAGKTSAGELRAGGRVRGPSAHLRADGPNNGLGQTHWTVSQNHRSEWGCLRLCLAVYPVQQPTCADP